LLVEDFPSFSLPIFPSFPPPVRFYSKIRIPPSLRLPFLDRRGATLTSSSWLRTFLSPFLGLFSYISFFERFPDTKKTLLVFLALMTLLRRYIVFFSFFFFFHLRITPLLGSLSDLSYRFATSLFFGTGSTRCRLPTSYWKCLFLSLLPFLFPRFPYFNSPPPFSPRIPHSSFKVKGERFLE